MIRTSFLLAILGLSPFAWAQKGALDGEWRFYGGDPGATRYSPLDALDATNVEKLEIAWTFAGRNFGPEPESKGETTPLMVNGVLYATAGLTRNVVALDAGTGELLW
ncbi:MAG: pyrroloquinoline quinone-dependent dehydrogenase, partial [Vicinamibacteria bacterium]